MRKVIFLNRFFYPDHSATSQILSDLVLKLDISDREIHVITSRMQYDDPSIVLAKYEVWNDIRIHRCWSSRYGRSGLLGRAIDYFTFYISSIFTMLSLVSKNDILVAKTDPPLISVLAAVVVKIKKAIIINWIQDLFPEVAKELNIKILKSFIYKPVKSLRNWSLNAAKYNVVLGEIMADKVEMEIHSPDKIITIPNWVIGQEMKPIPSEQNILVTEWGLNNKFIVGYSGNLGRAHDYKTILAAAVALQSNKDIVFLFIGGGAGYEILRSQVDTLGLSNVVFKKYQPSEKLSYSLSVPNIHLISLEPALEGLIVPSKFYGIISVGRAILFLGDNDGEIAQQIESANCGRSLSMGDKDGLVREITKLYENKKLCQEQSKNARLLYERKYLSKYSIMKWNDVIRDTLYE